jgi:hypothetical protein
MDQGCMVVFPSNKREVIKNNTPRDYKSLDENRESILNLTTKEEFIEKITVVDE